MAALDWFESIPILQERVTKLETAVASAYAAAGPKSQAFGSIGGVGGHDSFAGIDRIVDDDSVAELARLKAKLTERMDFACDVLYGRSGNGGVAKRVGTDEADMLLFHYCQGVSWAAIAKAFDPDTPNLTMWCKRKAIRVCREIDRIGMDALADS